MQTTSDALAAAITSPCRITQQNVAIDWDNDGYGGAPSLDDLSGHLSSVQVNQTLSTNVPDQVRIIPGATSAQLSATIEHGQFFRSQVDVAYRDIETYATTSSFTGLVSFTKPVNAVVGDLLIVAIVSNFDFSISTANVDWDVISDTLDESSAAIRIYLLQRRIMSDDPDTYDFNVFPDVTCAATLIHCGNAYIAGLHAQSERVVNSSDVVFTTIYGDRVTPTLDGCLIFDLFSAIGIDDITQWHFQSDATVLANIGSEAISPGDENVILGVASYSGVIDTVHTPVATVIPSAAALNGESYYETGVTDFDAGYSNATFSISDTYAHEGTHSLKVESDGSTFSYAVTTAISVTEFNTYTISGWCRPDSSVTNFSLIVDWYDIGDNYLTTTFVSPDPTLVDSSGWYFISATVSAPATATDAHPGVEIDYGVLGDTVYLDEFFFTLGDNFGYAHGTGIVNSLVIAPRIAGDVSQNPSWVLSELNKRSPLAGKQRVQRKMRWNAGFMTSDGLEEVPLFNGFSLGIDVSSKSRSAKVTALDNRELFRDVVELPFLVADWPRAITGETLPYKPGLESTWPVSYIIGKFANYKYDNFYERGFYAAPPPRRSTMCYVPCAGSLIPFVGDTRYAYAYYPNNITRAVRFDFGPYIGATEKAPLYGGIAAAWDPNAYGAFFYGTPRNVTAGRVEFYARLNDIGTSTLKFTIVNDADATDYVIVEITDAGYFHIISSMNGSVETLTGVSVPTDGEWHAYGVHWDSDSPSGVAKFCIDDTETLEYFTAQTSSGTAQYSELSMEMHGFAQVAEIHFTGGVSNLNVSGVIETLVTIDDPWVWESFVPTAFIDRSINELQGGLYEYAADEWTVLTAIAEAEFAAVYFDANGYPHYRTSFSDASAIGQTVVRELTATNALSEVAYTSDIKLVANHVTVSYSPLAATLSGTIWTPNTPIQLEVNEFVTLLFKSDNLVFTDDNFSVTLSEANTLANGGGSTLASGDFVVSAGMDANLRTGWVDVTNNSGVKAWLVDTSGKPSLTVTGAFLQSSSGDASPAIVDDLRSQVMYRVQPMSVSAVTWRQSYDFSRSLALKILTDMREIYPVIDDINVVADPRLELGDRIQLVDPGGLGLDDSYRIASITTKSAGGGLTQKISARRAASTATWDVNQWNDGTVWAVT